jgi:hypothetical protein
VLDVRFCGLHAAFLPITAVKTSAAALRPNPIRRTARIGRDATDETEWYEVERFQK